MPSTTSQLPASIASALAPYLPTTTHPPRSTAQVLASTTSQWLFTTEELASTPSIRDGMTQEQERTLRLKGLNFITQVGVMLKLPQLTLSTASVYFNRFLMRQSLVTRKPAPTITRNPDTSNPHQTPRIKALHHFQIAALSLHLSTKTSETPRKLKELIVACCRIAQKNPSLLVDEQDKDFWRWRDCILGHEDTLLETLCFDLEAQSPHRELMNLLHALGAQHARGLRNRAWALTSDSCLTVCCLRFSARAIAAAAIYAAARLGDDPAGEDGEGSELSILADSQTSANSNSANPPIKFQDDALGRPWWETHSIALSDIKGVCEELHQFFEAQPQDKVVGEQHMYARMGGWADESGEEDPTRLRDESDPSRLRVYSHSPGPATASTPGTPRDVHAQARQTSVKRSRDGTPKPTTTTSTSSQPPLPAPSLPNPNPQSQSQTQQSQANPAEPSSPSARARKINNNIEDTTRDLRSNGDGSSPRKRAKAATSAPAAAAAAPKEHNGDDDDGGGSEEGEVSE